MKKLTSTVLALIVALCAGQATATLEVVNTTTHKIETNRMENGDKVGYGITVDGKKTINGTFFLMFQGSSLSVEDLTTLSQELPAIPHEAQKLEFSEDSFLCPGTASAPVLLATVTIDADNDYFMCFTSGDDYGKNQFYVAFDMRQM